MPGSGVFGCGPRRIDPQFIAVCRGGRGGVDDVRIVTLHPPLRDAPGCVLEVDLIPSGLDHLALVQLCPPTLALAPRRQRPCSGLTSSSPRGLARTNFSSIGSRTPAESAHRPAPVITTGAEGSRRTRSE